VFNERIGSSALTLALLCLPLAILPGLVLEYYTTPKLVVACLSAALLCLAIPSWWPNASALWRTRPGCWLFGIQFAILASLLLSTLLSHNVALSLAGTPAQRLGFLTHGVLLLIAAALAVHVHRRRAFVKTALMAMEAAAGLAAIYAVLQYLGHDPFIPASMYTTQFAGGVLRPAATLGQATYLANFLLPGAFIAAWLFIRERRLAVRGLHGAVLAIAVGALLLSGTRSALLGLLAGGAVLACSEGRFLSARKLLRYVSIALLTFAAFMSALVISPVGRSFRVRLQQWSQDSLGGPRLMVWHDSLGPIVRHWAVGTGPETFAGEFRKIQSLELSRAYPDHYHEGPHNFLLEVAAGQGMVGLAAVLALLALGVTCGVRQVRQGGSEGGVLLASLAALIVSLQFSPLTIPVWFHLYIIVALLAGLTAPRSGAETMPIAVPAALRLLGPVPAVLMAGLAGLFLAQDALVAATGRRLEASDLDGASSSYALLRRSPFNGDSLWCSRQMALLARSLSPPASTSALSLAREASADAERGGDQTFSAFYQSATLAIIAGNAGEAERSLRAAISAAPNWYRAHLMLAQVLWSVGRAREAEQEAALALRCAGAQESTVRGALDLARAQSQNVETAR
jgi:O-antigen ligase